MKFWCFHFEGYFSSDAPLYSGEGVFSYSLVPADSYVDAEFSFLQALADEKINLVEIIEHFPVDTDPNEMDPTAEENKFWIEWCLETELLGKPTFDTFHLYPGEEVNRERPGN